LKTEELARGGGRGLGVGGGVDDRQGNPPNFFLFAVVLNSFVKFYAPSE